MTKLHPVVTAIILSACSLQAAEYHVSPGGLDSSPGTRSKPFKTISAAAGVAQPGDVITVHEGIYRERINPPRGGTSDRQRIVYRAAPGETVVIRGSEILKGWERARGNVWRAVVPNSFFGPFNPFDDLIRGDWFNGRGRAHHTGAVYLNGHWLTEATEKAALFDPELARRAGAGYLLNVAWMRMSGAGKDKVPAASLDDHRGIRKAPTDEGGECIGYIEDGDWAHYRAVDFGASTEHMEFRVASAEAGGIIEIRLDSPREDLLASCVVPPTGGWQNWRTVSTPIAPTSGEHDLCLVFRAPRAADGDRSLWFAEVGEEETTVWAAFPGVDPNLETVEVNVRQSVFYPGHPGRNYITVRGFTLQHAAAPWAPPTAEQIGLIGTHWSKGWIIEDNEIKYSTCVGITLGKYGDEFDNLSASADAYNRTIERALKNGWDKATVGSHVVRGNHISHCEQAGIVGSLGAVFSTVTGNEIHDIHVRRLFGGAEIAGIKFHAPIDSIISHNHVYRCGGTGGGIWLDWMTQGTRVTGNLLHDNSVDLFVEVNHGPFLVDNNVFLSPNFLRDWSEGGAFVHNLAAGGIVVRPQGRLTPFHKAHSTEVAGLLSIPGGDHRYLNNVFLNGIDLDAYEPFLDSVTRAGNVFLDSGADLTTMAGGVYLEMPEPGSGREQRALVTSDVLGHTQHSALPFEPRDGTAYRFDTDYFGKRRRPDNPGPGPFSVHGDQDIRPAVWPKQ